MCVWTSLSTAINVVNQFFAAMTGQNVYTAARKIPTEWAENETEKAMKSLKDLKKDYSRIDELNVLNKDNRSDAQKNGKTVADYRNMFEFVQSKAALPTSQRQSVTLSILGTGQT